jgi:hypothetical protein
VGRSKLLDQLRIEMFCTPWEVGSRFVVNLSTAFIESTKE